MKKTFILLAIGLCLASCASTPKVQSHRAEFYQNEKGKLSDTAKTVAGTAMAIVIVTEAVVGGGFTAVALGIIAAAENHRRQQKALATYRECRGLVETELWNCVREIDIQESRITADYVEPQRANLDDLVSGGQCGQYGASYW